MNFIINAEAVINKHGFKIDAEKNENVLIIDMSDEKLIEFLPVNVAEKFPNLQFYNAPDCAIKTIYKENFRDLSKLKYLNLYGNQLTKIESGIFDDLKSLTKLYLTKNKINSIDSDALKNLLQLQEIYLFGNRLKNLPKNLLANNKKLQKIWLNDNQIEKIPHDLFDGLTKFKYGNLSSNVCIKENYEKTDLKSFKDGVVKNC